MDYKELQKWDNKLGKMAKSYGLDWYPIIYEVCDFYDMIGNISYTGMPSHYQHWSFGKTFERTHLLYNMGQQGLPYEMIINSNPSIAYLMRENHMSLQVLIMAHCIGHSDFFKNNRMFENTNSEDTILKFKKASERVKSYIQDPSIGIDAVEKILDAAHSMKYQCIRHSCVEKRTHKELKEHYTKLIKQDKDKKYKHINIDKIPLEPDFNLLAFIRDHNTLLEDWEKDLITIVIEETNYFLPQAATKIMNEGWASFWHYKLVHELNLPQGYHLSCIKSHNQVIRPHLGGINPYHIGFTIFKMIEEKYGLDECFFVRETFHDESFLRTYLDDELCREFNLYSYSKKRKKWSIDEISDEEGWKLVRNDFLMNIGLNPVPKIYVDNLRKDNTLCLKHEHDDRDLDIDDAYKVLEHIKDLWYDEVMLTTTLEDEPFEF